MQLQSGTIGRQLRPDRRPARIGARAVAATPAAAFLPGAATHVGRRNAAQHASRSKSIVHRVALALVWLAIAASGIVFTEPAPTDALAMGLIVLLPVIGLVAISPMLTGYLTAWLLAAASGFLAATMAPELGAPATFTGVSLYLYLSSFVMAAFIAHSDTAHTRLVLNAWLVAALVATVAAVIGYFSLAPGAYEMFTRFGRATGTFKDPNVFGPFLVAPFLFALHISIDRPWTKIAIPLSAAGLLALGVFLSFSRGAWMNLALALVVYGWLAFVTAATEQRRQRIVQLVAVGTVLVLFVIAGALQNERIDELLQERAALTQSYDVGPEGRFGGQEKALNLIAENPLGIGATVFSTVHHHEEVHNVYLSMMLNAGWIGGGVYWLMTILTIALGFRHALHHGARQPLFLIAYAAFVSNALEGVIIDIDHWRHLYLLMAIVWGLMSSRSRCGPGRAASRA